MRLILFHCRKIEVQKAWETNSWEKALFAFVCPEKNDSEDSKKEALGIIFESLSNLKENKIVLVPFPYLSAQVCAPDITQKTLQWLQKRFEKKKYITAQCAFETSERVSFDLIGHKLAVAFREVKAEQK